jgi:hypothetical protein
MPLRDAHESPHVVAFVMPVRPWCDPSQAYDAQGLELTIDRETLAVRDRHLARERIRAGVT